MAEQNPYQIGQKKGLKQQLLEMFQTSPLGSALQGVPDMFSTPQPDHPPPRVAAPGEGQPIWVPSGFDPKTGTIREFGGWVYPNDQSPKITMP